MYELKGVNCTPDMQAFADKLADETVIDIKLPVPRGFTGGRQCFYATLLISREHLPLNYLANSFFPVLVNLDETDTVTVLPKVYWDDELRSTWRRQ